VHKQSGWLLREGMLLSQPKHSSTSSLYIMTELSTQTKVTQHHKKITDYCLTDVDVELFCRVSQ